MPGTSAQDVIQLPEPVHDGSVSVEYALLNRRSVRHYRDEPLSLSDISQLLWAAQGITAASGLRTAPSAGALFPLEVYIVAGNITHLPPGIYKFNNRDRTIFQNVKEDKRSALCQAALNQKSIARAPAVLLICAVYERVTRTYGRRGVPYTLMEIGHAAQNVCLQAVAMGMGTVVIGAFRDEEIKMIANLAKDEQPVYIIPVGKI